MARRLNFLAPRNPYALLTACALAFLLPGCLKPSSNSADTQKLATASSSPASNQVSAKSQVRIINEALQATPLTAEDVALLKMKGVVQSPSEEAALRQFTQ